MTPRSQALKCAHALWAPWGRPALITALRVLVPTEAAEGVQRAGSHCVYDDGQDDGQSRSSEAGPPGGRLARGPGNAQPRSYADKQDV